MINQQISDYIKECLGKGAGRGQISDSLMAAGWSKEEVAEALKSIPLDVAAANIKSGVSLSAPKLAADQTKPESVSFLKTDPGKPSKSSSKFFSKIKLIIITAVIGVLVLGGGVFAYYRYFQQTPEKVMAKMMQNIDLVKTVEYSGEMNISFKVDASLAQSYNLGALVSAISSSSQPNQLVVNFSGASDSNVPDNVKSRFSFTIDTSVPDKKTLLSLETLGLDKIVYLKLTSLPDLGFINLDFLKNQWVKVTPDSLKNETGFIGISLASSSPLSEQFNKLKALLKSSNIFQVSAQLPDEALGGTASYHYKLAVNRDNLQKFLVAASEIPAGKKLTADNQVKLKEASDKVDFSGLEVWVSKKDYLPTKLSFISSIKGGAGAEAGKINLSLVFKNFNQPLEIKAPESFKTLQEMIGQIFNNFMIETGGVGGEFEAATSSPGPESLGTTTLPVVALDSDNDGLSNQEEIKMGTDPYNPDTDGDGYSDGAEIKSGYNPKGAGKLVN